MAIATVQPLVTGLKGSLFVFIARMEENSRIFYCTVIAWCLKPLLCYCRVGENTPLFSFTAANFKISGKIKPASFKIKYINESPVARLVAISVLRYLSTVVFVKETKSRNHKRAISVQQVRYTLYGGYNNFHL